MHKVLMTLALAILATCSLAWAGDLDENTVIREEHVNKEQPASDSGNHREAKESRDMLSSEHAQDIISARVLAMENGGGPTTLELDSLGLYFGLGEHFIDMANGAINTRNSGYPVFSRLSDTDFSEIGADGERSAHRHGSDNEGASEDEDFGLNRRGADHDYFYD